mmetsp:Transcript_8150/g.11836  ORF Transcript_8150/g.11836 Transcript_8150/m.11836 type:complete len:379 (+) Transcript_8150:120-1256(+)
MMHKRRIKTSLFAPVLISAVFLFSICVTTTTVATSIAQDIADEEGLSNNNSLIQEASKDAYKARNLRAGRRLQEDTALYLPDYSEGGTLHAPAIPRAIAENIAMITDPITPEDTAFFWHIPKAGGSTVKAYYGKCFHLVEATQIGGLFGHDQDEKIDVFSRGDYLYVNVDPSTPQGLEHAKDLGLAESGLADIVFTSYAHGGSKLFNPVHRGRFFAIFRHPMERAASLFYYRQTATWEKIFGFSSTTFEDFLHKGRGEKNWMVRLLTNKFTEKLSGEDLEVAKEVLRTRCVIGLMDRMEESLERFNTYFGWSSPDGDDCKNDLLHGGVNRNPHPKIEVGSEVWNLLYEQNELDIKLYEYAQVLFEEQRLLFSYEGSQR